MVLTDPVGVVRGSLEGRVAGADLQAPRGSEGFGYDPLFFYEPAGKKLRGDDAGGEGGGEPSRAGPAAMPGGPTAAAGGTGGMSEGQSPRILIVRRSSLGDLIVSLPALVALRRGFPHAHIAWLVEDELADLVRGHECLDEVLTLRRLSARVPLQWWRESRQVGRQLRERNFDLAVDLQGRGKSALMRYLSGAPRRLGFSGEVGGLLGMRWINERVPLAPGTAAVPRALAMANYLGAPIYPVEFRYPLAPEARAWAQELAPRTGPPLVALVLGASTAVKSWPVAHFVRLIEILRGEGMEVILIGAGAEAEREAAVQAALPAPALSAVGNDLAAATGGAAEAGRRGSGGRYRGAARGGGGRDAASGAVWADQPGDDRALRRAASRLVGSTPLRTVRPAGPAAMIATA